MKNISKAMLASAVVAVAGSSIIASANTFAYGDNIGGRTGYTLSQIESGILGDRVVLNSITDQANIGHEFNFVRAREYNTNNKWDSNEIIVEDGKSYVINLYVHNNSPRGLEAIAKDVTVSFNVPGISESQITVKGDINSSNAYPTTYWDDIVLKSADGSKFHLDYLMGTAHWDSNGKSAGALSDAIITDGVKVGYDALDGNLPGCYQYSGYASIIVKAVYDHEISFTKSVRLKGTKEWSDAVEAKVGDIVQYKLVYTNNSGADAKDVILNDYLPNNVEYVKGSTKIKNITHPELSQWDDNLVTTGTRIGDYTNGSNAIMLFDVKVVDKSLVCNKKNEVVNTAKVTANDKTLLDDATIIVNKTCNDKKTPEEKKPAETPKEIENAGAGSAIFGALGAGSIVIILGYAIASRKRM